MSGPIGSAREACNLKLRALGSEVWDQGFRVHGGGFRVQRVGLIMVHTHRAQSSSFLGFPYRILNMNPKKELLWGLWVGCREPV